MCACACARALGWIDDFFWYDYPLGAEEVLAHYVLPRPPVYELTFSHDPRLIQNAAYNYTYRWTDVDDHDPSNITRYHNGHLVLIGDEYIDLEAQAGNASIGARPMPMIGGVSGANGTLPQGWSIEVLFKPSKHELWAKVFDIGGGVAMDNLILGYDANTTLMRFEVYNSLSANQSIMTVINDTRLDRWYHVVITMQPHTWAGARVGTVRTYVDGVAGWWSASFNLPRPVMRARAYIGKSNWANEYLDMYLDTFRLYDYTLSAHEVHDLYTVTHEELPNNTMSAGAITHHYHTAPVSAYTFTRRPTGLLVDGTNFRWDGVDFKFPHQGVALFNGVNEYINVATYPSNADGAVLPMFGGAFTIEAWVMWDAFRLYSRIMDLGSLSGYTSHNIILANQGTTNNLMFEVYSGTAWSQVLVTDALSVGVWHHVTASVEQRSINDTYSAQSATLRLYIDGVERGNSAGYVPQLVPRPNGFIARSNWPNDAYFAGKIDALYFYDYALSVEQVSAHYLVPKPPVFELAFSRDPRPWVSGVNGMGAFSYEWAAFDPADFITNSTATHNGHLVLMGDSWVNLTAASGPNSIGTTLDDILFGEGSGALLDSGGRWYGWTIEILVKIDKQEVGAKLFDLGVGPNKDNIGMGFWDQRDRLNLYVYGGPDGSTGLAIPVIEQVVLKQWYHIVVVMRRSGSEGKGDYQVYVNGDSLPPSNDYLPWPRAVHRSTAFIARSPWVGDQYMDMYLDTFRIYDIGLTADYVQKLYMLTISDPTPPQEPLYHTGPLLSYTFDAPPSAQYLTAGTAFTWQQGNFPHTGLATFDGRTEYINLMTFPDDTGVPFPTVMGNQSFSFEAWVRWDELKYWSRIIDLGNGGEGDNILLANFETTGRVAFETYLSAPNTTILKGSLWTGVALNAGQWHHVVATLDDLTKYPANAGLNPAGPSAAWMRVFVDGALWGENSGPRPRAVQRTLAYMAKSHWSWDDLFHGAYDSFYYYDYALSPEQINVHMKLPRPAVFDLSFDADPRWLLGGTYGSYTYQWAEFDPADAFANNTRYHSGHLVLDGSSWQTSYVNLSTVVGMSTVGVQLPRIGGLSTPPTGTQNGWSFEIIVKVSTVGRWAKLIDWAKGPVTDNNLDSIVVGYLDNSRTLEFRVWNSVKGVDAYRYINITDVVLNQWYHIVVVVTSIGNYLDYNARYDAYVDGRLTATVGDGFFPQQLRRNSALLGRTNWVYSTDAPFAAKVDAIRVYDYALTLSYVRELYALAHDPSAIPPSRLPSSTAAPQPARVSSSSTAALRASSSSSTAGATSVRRSSSSSSSSSPTKRCPAWTLGGTRDYEPNCRCPDGGRYPYSCYCPDDQDGFWPYCDDPSDWTMSSSTATAAPGTSGPSSSLIAGIVVVLLAGAAAAMFVYYKYFRTGGEKAAQRSASGAETNTTGLLAGHTNGASDAHHPQTELGARSTA